MTPLISLAQKQGDKANDMKASSDSDRSWSWDCYTRFDAYKKVSNVHALSKADYVHFIVGEVTTVATSRNSLLTTRKRTLKESEKEEESEKEVESEKEEESDDDDQTGDAEDAST
jgi:hypothetical protein